MSSEPPLKADIAQYSLHVSNVPLATIRTAANYSFIRFQVQQEQLIAVAARHRV